jgi:Zn-dependent protease
MNPLAHVDLLGTVIIPFAMLLFSPGFVILGWAKPVPINPRYFKGRRGLCEIAVSLAGPFSNLVLAVVSALVGAYAVKRFGGNIGSLFATMCWLNVILCAFNLIPIPPLDGAYLFKTVLRISDLLFFRMARYGVFVLLVLINVPAFRATLYTCIVEIFMLISRFACYLFGVPHGAIMPF